MGDYQNGRARNLLHVLLLLRTSTTSAVAIPTPRYIPPPRPSAPRRAETARRNAVRYIMVVDYRDSLVS